MPAKFIGKTQGPVHDAIVGENDSVFKRASANEAHGLEGFDIAFEAKRSGTSKQVAESLRADHHLYFLLADEGVRKIHVAAHAKFIGGIYADAAVALDDFERPQNLQVASPSAELSNAALLQHLHKRLGGAIQDRYFNRINVDENVVNAAGIDGGEQVLGGGEENALLHEARGITYARHVVALRLDGKVIEVHAAKNDAGFGRRWDETNVAIDASVESYAFGNSRAGDGSLKHSCAKW